MRLAPFFAALLCSALLPSLVHATEVEMANDRIGAMGMANLNFGGQLIKGEAVAETFTLPLNYLPFTVTKARFIAGPGGQASLTIIVYEDLGTPTPGRELARMTPTDPVEGNIMFIQEVDLPPAVATVKNIRVAIFTDTPSDSGGVAVPFDPGTPTLGSGTICSIDPQTPNTPCKWITAKSVGVRGPFIIRLVGETPDVSGGDDGGVTTNDMTGGPKGADMTGGGSVNPGSLTLSSITPSSLAVDQGGKLAVIGGGFLTMTTVVLDGEGGPVKLTNAFTENPGAISATVPAGLAAGSYDVVVQNPDGTSARLSKALSITSAAKGSGCDATLGGQGIGGGALAGAIGLLGGAFLLRRRREPRA